MRHLWLLFVLCALPMADRSFGQGVDLRGVVADSSTGERIPYVSVSITGTGQYAITNLKGFYLIPNVQRGRVEIVASSLGYDRQVRQILVQGREPMTVDFQLSPRPIEAPEILVEGEQGLLPSEAQSSIHVMSKKEIQVVPVAGQADLIRAIQVLPGVVSTSDVSSKFYVRGGAGDQNLIMLDGMRVYNPYHAFGIFSIFDPDIIKTTELYTGAFPAGYGNRLSSVLNVTTRNGNKSRVAGNASINSFSGKLQLEGPLPEENSWIVSGRRSLFDQTFRYFLKQPVPVSFYDLFAKVTLGSSTSQHSFRGFVSGDDVKSERSEEPDYKWRNQAYAASVSGLISDRVYVEGVASGNQFLVRRDTKGSATIPAAESKVQENSLRMELTFYTESREQFFGGFEVDFLGFENTLPTGSGRAQVFSENKADAWAWFRYLTAIGDLKLDAGFHSDIGSLFSRGASLAGFQPRINMSYSFAETWRAKLSYGVFTQNVVTINNEDDIISLFEAWIYVPSYLKPEEAHHYVAGVEGNIIPNLAASLQSYYKSYPSLVLYNREKVFGTDPDFVNGTGESYGAEVLLRYGTTPLDLYLAYTLGWTTVTTGGFEYSPRYDRRHTINAMGVVHPLEVLDVTLRWEYGSGYPYSQTVGYYDRVSFQNFGRDPLSFAETGSPYSLLGSKNSSRLPAYHRMDLSVTYRFSIPPVRGTAGISIMNLYNTKNILFYDRKTGQRLNMVPFFPSVSLNLEF